MSQPVHHPLDAYVYRRVSPRQGNRKKNEVASNVFVLEPGYKGLSVYRADKATPYQVLEALIESKRELLASEDEAERNKAQTWLDKNPNVETLVQKDWLVVRLSVADIENMGFHLEEPDKQGHLNILGEMSLFEDKQADFTELVKTGKAAILSADECLAS